MLQCLADWFQGNFDNVPQVGEDQHQNMEPREGGGHEHFHCTLVLMSCTSQLAAFSLMATLNVSFVFGIKD
jgi:hypothetical protein